MGPFITCGTLCNHCEIGLGALLHSDEMNEVSDEPSSFNELTENPSLTGFHDVIDENMQLPLTYIYDNPRCKDWLSRGTLQGHVNFNYHLLPYCKYFSYIKCICICLHTKKIKKRKSRGICSGPNAQCNPLQPLKAKIQALLGYRMSSKLHHCTSRERFRAISVLCYDLVYRKRKIYQKKILIAVVSVESSYTAS